MSVKDDFISLFRGHEVDINNLPERFTLKDFTYMYTSQRTMGRIHEKLKQILEGRAVGVLHGNFWIDLRNMGLVKIDSDNVSDFGIAVFDYFNTETDEFKREHFILSGVRQKAYDVSDDVYELYNRKVNELFNFVSIIPPLNEIGKELLNNPEKLLITGFLNAFPFALNRYFELSESQQTEIDSLHESGLKGLFPQHESDTPYYKIAKRLWNVWRAPYRRVNFVKSVILSEYEERVGGDINQKIPFEIIDRHSKIVNENILREIIRESEDLKITEEEAGGVYIERRMLSLPSTPTIRKAKRTHIIKKKRKTKRRRITSADQLRIEPPSSQGTPPRIIDPAEQALINELRLEKSSEHNEIIIKFWEFYSRHGIPTTDENNFDLLVERNNTALLHEMKTITDDNERIQVIKAIGQLFYYEFFDLLQSLKNENVEIIKMMAFQRKPNDEMHIDYIRSLGIYVYWINERGEIDGEADSMQFLNNFISS